MRCLLLIISLLPLALFGCGKSAPVQILHTANVTSKVSAICSKTRIVYISDVSEDASVVVGKCALKQAPDVWQAFRYSHSGGTESAEIIGIKGIDEIYVSADGAVIWGTFRINNIGSHIFRYTKSDGLQDLGTMGKEGISASVHAVSSDGSVIVGDFHNSRNEYPMLYHAFRYSPSNGFEDLGAISTESTHARGISADGSLIVGNLEMGTSNNSAVRNISSHAFLYSRIDGMREFGESGWNEWIFPSGISNDGHVIVGEIVFTLGFIASLYESSDVFIYSEKNGLQKLGALFGKGPRVVRVTGDGTRLFGSYTDSKHESYVYTAKIAFP